MDETDGLSWSRVGVLEDLAVNFVGTGFPRMPSRVLAALMVSDTGELTAAALAEALSTSPSAVSGAVRYLETIGLVQRFRHPGSRRDVFRFDNEVWHGYFHRNTGLAVWIDTLRAAADRVGSESGAGERMLESAEFFSFLLAELDGIMARWEARES